MRSRIRPHAEFNQQWARLPECGGGYAPSDEFVRLIGWLHSRFSATNPDVAYLVMLARKVQQRPVCNGKPGSRATAVVSFSNIPTKNLPGGFMIKARHVGITLTLFVSALFAGCGGGSGGGGGGSSTPAAPSALATTTTAEGFWSGPASTGTNVSLVVLETGETWGVYSLGNAVVGALHGSTTSSGTTLSGAGSDFNIPARTVTPGTFTGTFAAKSTISVTTSLGAVFNGTYGNAYDTAASLTSVAGSFSGSGVTATTSAQTVGVGISSLGVISATGIGCSAAGTAAPRSTGKNVFNVTVTFTGSSCVLGSGTVTTGVAYYDVASRQLLVMALNAAKTDGFLYLASKL
jgi:hypothetical protein